MSELPSNETLSSCYALRKLERHTQEDAPMPMQ